MYPFSEYIPAGTEYNKRQKRSDENFSHEFLFKRYKDAPLFRVHEIFDDREMLQVTIIRFFSNNPDLMIA
jgi:hypothetical protein